MDKIWSDKAWDDYLDWQKKDKKTFEKINKLIKDIDRNGESEGIGKPEPLKGDLSGFWSRRINEKDRLVYRIEDGRIEIALCQTHYDDH